jgi:prepilin-type N-terminal cleavage/methylation domain-containing protein
MPMKNKKYAFTLVELIVVITIVSILATIAFVSFSNYNKNSRDSVRLATLKNIESGINIFQVKTSQLPQPEGEIYQWFIGSWVLVKQGFIWDTITRNIQLSKNPTDPVFNTKILYSMKLNSYQFQLSTTLENISNLTYLGNKSYASTISTTVQWNYDWKILYQSWSQTCVTNVPSLLFTNKNDVQLLDSQTYFIYNKSFNLPIEVSWESDSKRIDSQTIIKNILSNSDAQITGVCSQSKSELITLIQETPEYLASFWGNKDNIPAIIEWKITMASIIQNAGWEIQPPNQNPENEINFWGTQTLSCPWCSS